MQRHWGYVGEVVGDEIHLFSKHLLNVYYVPVPKLGTGCTTNKTGTCPHGIDNLLGSQTVNKQLVSEFDNVLMKVFILQVLGIDLCFRELTQVAQCKVAAGRETSGRKTSQEAAETEQGGSESALTAGSGNVRPSL